ncbi:MAG: LacI family DNA-binding transcriptional regulator [Clostridia bacterium]|nr:LacI family DNA-binding transcriptional regulator [Clostridia bacterium]
MTIKDIARKAGVSVSTVSRALNGHPDVSEALRKKILEIVRAEHYVPNSSARDLVLQESDTIGLIVRGIGNPFFTELIPLIEEAIVRSGYTPFVEQIATGADEIRAGAALARSKKLRGLIFLGGRFDYTEEDVAVLSVPFVCCSYTNSFGTLPETSYSSVSIDDEKTAALAVTTLTERGHKRIAVILDTMEDHSISELRYRGYLSALRDAGIEPDPALVVETNAFTMPEAYRGIRRLAASGTEFTAVFSISDSMAVAAIRALVDAGKRVPEDCSVIAIDGIPFTEYTVPVLTTLVQPTRTMAERSVSTLIGVIEGRGKHRHLLLETGLRTGGSVRPRTV